MTDEQFLKAVLKEVKRARKLFPQPNAINAAMVEEVGEVSKALMYEPWSAVIKEAIQVAAMALRLSIEGDPCFYDWRSRVVHEGGERYMRNQDIMP